MTMPAAVPRPDCHSFNATKYISQVPQLDLAISGTEAPPGITASRLSQPPRTPPQCVSISSRMGIPMASSTLQGDRKSTRLNSSHQIISYAVFCLKKKKKKNKRTRNQTTSTLTPFDYYL